MVSGFHHCGSVGATESPLLRSQWNSLQAYETQDQQIRAMLLSQRTKCLIHIWSEFLAELGEFQYINVFFTLTRRSVRHVG